MSIDPSSLPLFADKSQSKRCQDTLRMSTVQKADPAVRRKAILIAIVGTVVGTLLIIGLERGRTPFLNWLLSEAENLPYKLGLFYCLAAFFGSAPLFAFAVYLWSLGDRVMSARRFPLPGHPVIRDTPILEGQVALARGRIFKIMAISLGIIGIMLCYVFWVLTSTLARSSV